MSVTVRSATKDESVLTFAEWVDLDEKPDVRLEAYAAIAHVQDDRTVCLISEVDSITFIVYDSVTFMRDDLQIDDDATLTVLSAIDITYSKQME